MPRESRRSKATAKKSEEAREESSSPTTKRKKVEIPKDDSFETSRPSSTAADPTVTSDGEDDGSDSSESSEDEAPVPLMVTQRNKRSTAGNKMASLLSTADHEDEFYKTAYGGFEENNEIDKEYESPPSSDEDEVDSDFDKPEDEEEPSAAGDGEEERPRKKRKIFKEPKRGLTADDVLAKNKKWAMARLAGNMVAPNTVDEKTQEKMLKEAEQTEKINVESLRRYEEFELEKKKRREKGGTRILPHPRIIEKITQEGTTLTIPEIKVFRREKPREKLLCAVTGRPARYKDPVTQLPYSTPYAFKVIRDKYHKFLKTTQMEKPAVADYLRRWERLPPPAPPSPHPTTETDVAMPTSCMEMDHREAAAPPPAEPSAPASTAVV
ncbi:unnamed protein product [Caenorhabditis auriculariae]|uniref:Vacuolar protein sorting-associated protein 72 homolog n=1 Tax=Caenorhabditis auriculariae TaxID=2777116 RepID=A0A8S1GMJ4_9PELO|nr:unnamed protein product [Caenorhabditis auriculariae]